MEVLSGPAPSGPGPGLIACLLLGQNLAWCLELIELCLSSAMRRNHNFLEACVGKVNK